MSARTNYRKVDPLHLYNSADNLALRPRNIAYKNLMKRPLPLLTLSLSLFLGCGKDKPTEVSNNQTPPEESGDNGDTPPEATPEKGSAKSGKNAESGQRPGGRFGRGGGSIRFANVSETTACDSGAGRAARPPALLLRHLQFQIQQ